MASINCIDLSLNTKNKNTFFRSPQILSLPFDYLIKEFNLEKKGRLFIPHVHVLFVENIAKSLYEYY